MTKYCNECEIEMSDFAKFCPECGSRLVDVRDEEEEIVKKTEKKIFTKPVNEHERDEAEDDDDFESEDDDDLEDEDTSEDDSEDEFEEDEENVKFSDFAAGTRHSRTSVPMEYHELEEEIVCAICGSDTLLKCRQCGADVCKTHGFSAENMNVLRTKIQNALRYANVGHIFYEYYPNWEGIICKNCLLRKFDQSISKTKEAYSDHTKSASSRSKIGKALDELKAWKKKIFET